ncbi:hypothetical protein NUSPORA_00764 [Nucleospora cyclopteri]
MFQIKNILIVDFMSLNEPNITVFINDIRKLKRPEDIKQHQLNELKHIAAQNELNVNSKLSGVVKQLFLQLKGVAIDEIDFVKCISNQHLEIKKSGLIGLVNVDKPKSGILLYNTIKTDLSKNICVPDYLTFLCNFKQINCNFGDLNDEFKISENDSDYNKLLIFRAKHLKQFDPLISQGHNNLMTKLQIIQKYNIELSENDILYLLTRITKIACPFLMCKILQVLKNFDYSIVDIKTIKSLKNQIINKTDKAKKQIEIAKSLEICHFLIRIKQFDYECESFIFRLINSQNKNSQVVGINFVLKCHKNGLFYSNINKNNLFNLAKDKCIENIEHQAFFADTLRQFVIKENCIDIYLEIQNKSRHSNIIRQIYNVTTDNLFRNKILYEVPEIYQFIRSKKEKMNICDFISSKKILHFPIIYDNWTGNQDIEVETVLKTHLQQIFIGHLSILKLNILNEMFGFIITHGDLEKNREILLQYKSSKPIIPGVLLFNLVLPKKIAYIKGKIHYYTVLKNRLYVENAKVMDENGEIKEKKGYFDISNKQGNLSILIDDVKKLIIK